MQSDWAACLIFPGILGGFLLLGWFIGWLGESAEAGDIDDRVRNLILEGKKIEAIKLYREMTGLKAAKDAVDGM